MRSIPSFPGLVVLRKLAAGLLVIAAWSAVASAQEGAECRNLIGIYTAPDPTAATAQALANYNGAPGLITAYVVITNPYNAGLDQPTAVIGGFEFRLDVPAGATIVAADLPPLSNNFHPDPDNWLVGTNLPVVDGNAVLLTMTIAEFAGTPGELFLAPVSRYPSIPGNICIADYEDEFSLSAAQPGSGDFALPVFGLYTGDAVRRQAPCGFTTWHVATDGDDAWPGTSLAPFRTIGRGIEAAVSRDTVLVNDGTYTGPGNRDLDLSGKGLTIRSASGIPDQCVLDAEYTEAGMGWNVYSRTDGDSVAIEGLTLTRGRAGAIRIGNWFHRAVTLRNCSIANTDTGVCAMAFLNAIDCSISNCRTGIVSSNEYGAWGPPMLIERVQFDHCIVGAVPGTFGGKAVDAIYGAHLLLAGYNSQFIGCVFEYNNCGSAATFESHVSFNDCTFRSNGRGSYGFRPWAADYNRCEFTGNTIAGIEIGGDWDWGDVRIDSCRVNDNPGNGISVSGVGGVLIAETEILNSGGTGVLARAEWSLEITGCIVAGNGNAGLDLGGGWNSYREVPIIVSNSTIARNGSGIQIAKGKFAVATTANAIVALNTGEGLADDGVLYSHCDVYGNGADNSPDSWIVGTDGNFARDPLFCDPDNGDYGIAANSPCAPSVLHDLIGAGAVACAGIPAPVLLAVEDIPADQGSQVRLTWYRSGHDEAGSADPILGYDVYRRIDAAAAAAPRKEPGAKLLGWDYLLRVPARGDQGYQVIAPTLCDSTIAGGLCESTFLVSAVTDDPLVYFDSEPESGYSVDNLAPLPPVAVTATYQAAGVALDWDDAPDADFRLFRIYRDTDPEFTPATINFVDSTGVSGYDDPFANPWGQYYKITAVDFAGNEGQPGSPQDPISGVGETSLPARTALLGAAPNPFNPMTRLSFELATPGPVRLRVYDLAGRVVATLADGRRDAGRYEVVWDGRDDGGRAVSSGVYLYLLDAGAYRESKRMVLVR